MPKLFVKDLKVGEKIDSFFVLKQKDQKKTSKGDDYLILRLADRTGEIECRWWDGFAEVLPQLKEGVILRIYAEVSEYQGKKQLTVKKAKLAEPQEINNADFVRQTNRDIPEMYTNLQEIINMLSDQDIKKLLQAFFADPQFAANFQKAPAAVSMHSACIGGLLEHVSNMVDQALFVSGQYKTIDKDMLIAGVILHDIGKLKELEYSSAFKYSDEGLLVGHIVMGVQMLNDKIKTIPGFPEEKRLRLEHMIVSHHGTSDFGSPKSPMTLEAVILHYLDNLEAKITGYNEFVELNHQPGTSWTPKAYMFENRPLFLGENNA